MSYPNVEELSLDGEYTAKGTYVQFFFQWWDSELGMYCRSQPRIANDGLTTHWEKLNREKKVEIELFHIYDKGRAEMTFYPFDAEYLTV